MKYAIISGSHRVKSQSEKVGRVIEEKMLKSFPGCSTYFLQASSIPTWDEEVWKKSEEWTRIWAPISAELKSCDGIVVISPEWGGMVPPALKNFFLLCGAQELAHKPGLIVSVSAGIAGSYPVSELRMSSYKNTQISYIPEHIIVRKAEDVLNDPHNPASDEDKMLHERLDHSLQVLDAYSKALHEVRASGALEIGKFPYGM